MLKGLGGVQNRISLKKTDLLKQLTIHLHPPPPPLASASAVCTTTASVTFLRFSFLQFLLFCSQSRKFGKNLPQKCLFQSVFKIFFDSWDKK